MKLKQSPAWIDITDHFLIGFSSNIWSYRCFDIMRVILLLILSLDQSLEALGSVQLEPKLSTVVNGSRASFNCSTTAFWDAMSWLLNGSVSLTISARHGVLGSSDRFHAVNHSTASLTAWEFIIESTEQNDTGSVTCDLQKMRMETTTLLVQVIGSVEVQGGDVMKRRGEKFYFECRVFGWDPEPTVRWKVNGTEVEEAGYNTSTVVSGGLLDSTSFLGFRAEGSVTVECLASVPALQSPRNSSVFLTVAGEPDVSLVIAFILFGVVFVSLLVFAAVVFIITRQRESKASCRQEMRNRRQCEGNTRAEVLVGELNLGFSFNGQTESARLLRSLFFPWQISTIADSAGQTLLILPRRWPPASTRWPPTAPTSTARVLDISRTPKESGTSR
ncbi:immunoglobulin superfamily member 5-like isoform X2 [Brienomyrus brachyistius]|uniref:immunoglobulin superfamily member 5-like isoform X2 n=1 Tax=Brienomyrus brachyistius TaxID=42636 RepID=UPI0020B207BB|nr:immunoglobulin superfamily member 5-like isoform X2 [Brienomyrus brachyistius]